MLQLRVYKVQFFLIFVFQISGCQMLGLSRFRTDIIIFHEKFYCRRNNFGRRRWLLKTYIHCIYVFIYVCILYCLHYYTIWTGKCRK